MTTATALAISLEVDCGSEACEKIAAPLLEQLSSGDYDVCSVQEIPPTIDEWLAEHRTARKRAARSARRGYVVAEIQRERHEDEIYAINRSRATRQGRPMAPAYTRRQTFSPLPKFDCPRHAIRTLGVLSFERTLVGYLTMHRAGQLALVSQILGHGEHEENEIMYQLFAGALALEVGAGPGFCVYNRHDSGTDGLRFLKERLGFAATEVEWLR